MKIYHYLMILKSLSDSSFLVVLWLFLYYSLFYFQWHQVILYLADDWYLLYNIPNQSNYFLWWLKKKGYNSLLDYNDKEYSSYHAKKPIIVFDIDSVKLSSVAEMNPKIIDKLYKRYNTERIAKEAVTNTIGLISRYAGMTIGDCGDYVKSKMEKYLSWDGRRNGRDMELCHYGIKGMKWGVRRANKNASYEERKQKNL